jgi:tetratricopeptide (TPR) repeat protein
MRDAAGLEVTADTDGLAAWQAAVDAVCVAPGDAAAVFREAVDIAPDLAVLRALRASLARTLDLGVDPRSEATAAEQALDAGPVSAREAALVTALVALVAGGPLAAAPSLARYLDAYPGDTAAFFPASLAFEFCAIPGMHRGSTARADALVANNPGDWRALGLAAFPWSEAGRHDDAAQAIDTALAARPANAHAAHARAHVHYETGRHEEGLAQTGAWMRGHPSVFSRSHLPWHLALHELALGRGDDALNRVGSDIAVGELADAGPLLWRCRLAGVPGADPSPFAAAAARSALALGLPMAFVPFNAALALAAAGDAEGLEALAHRLSSDTRPGFADLVAPVARGLGQLLLGEPAQAVRILEPLLPQLERIGGSNAQREVLTQTCALARLS